MPMGTTSGTISHTLPTVESGSDVPRDESLLKCRSESLSMRCLCRLNKKVKDRLLAPIGGNDLWHPQLRQWLAPSFCGGRGLHGDIL